MTRLFVLARHGESTLNAARVVNGDPAVDVPLTEKGRQEARLLGQQLHNVPLEPLFDDVDVGDLEGAHPSTITGSGNALTLAPTRSRTASTSTRAAVRYGRALESLLSRPERAILVVTHEIPVRYALNAAQGSRDPDSPHHDIANATPYLFGEELLAEAASRLATGPRGM